MKSQISNLKKTASSDAQILRQKGFTLIELLVVISILGVLATLVVTNLNEARGRARDSAKKQGLSQLKTALRLYYNDYGKFPASCTGNAIAGCGTSGITCCPVSGCPEFSAGATCSTTYMSKLPTGLGDGTIAYYYSATNDSYCIKATLENASDSEISSGQIRCLPSSCGLGSSWSATDYVVCSD